MDDAPALHPAAQGGMALVNVHPDYVNFEDSTSSAFEFPSAFYAELLEYVRPVHEIVPVEAYLPGCPPSAERIKALPTKLLCTGHGAPVRF